jgi:PIN domain nuclease of toxin-antitoxin system
MRILIDSHVLIWWMNDSDRLSDYARSRIANPATEILVSSITLFEINMKISLGKLDIRDSLPDHLSLNNLQMLSFELNHAMIGKDLPWHHRDPFDRMIIAQALAEKIPIMTSNDKISQYGVSTIRA